MSDNWIIIIPEEAAHVPSEDAQERAVALFRHIAPQADEVKKEVSPEVRFIDCGGNLSRIFCPHCGAELEMDWWQEQMDEEVEAGFPIRNISLSCCGHSSSLQTLRYDWPQGFARFSVEAMNPGIPDLSEEQLAEFEQTLGCPVRKVLQRL
jgi:hypothetical protein